MRTRAVVWACAVAFALLPRLAAGGAKSAAIDAKDAPLVEVVRLLAAQAGATLDVHPDLAATKLTFAAKEMSPAAALRWLCRTHNYVVATSKAGRPTLCQPGVEPVEEKEYNVAKLVTSQEDCDALVNFIKKVVFELHPIREQGDDGVRQPLYDAVCEKGKLKVAAPALAQREVLALLRAMAKVQPKRSQEDVRVPYASHEVGLLGSRSPSALPRLTGEVTLSVTDVTPREAASALTSAANVSFYVDPWDTNLSSVKVTLNAEKQRLSVVVDQLAQQLGAGRCWYDEAWLFARDDRRPVFDSLLVRAYNVGGSSGGARWFAMRLFRDLGRFQQNLRKDLPYDVERLGDLLLVAGPEEWHEPVEEFVKTGVDVPMGPIRGPFGPHHRRH